MRNRIVAGNWKMNGSRGSVAALTDALRSLKTEAIVFPPFVFLEQVENSLKNSSVSWGGQTLSAEKSGAFTGEISASMLLDFGCRYVLVGHSERRTLYGETNEIVAKKWLTAYQASLLPVLCVGETQTQREKGETTRIIAEQLAAILNLRHLTKDAIIAYEPVWAIGTGLTATPEQAQEVHAMIRAEIAKHDVSLAEKIRIIYGGSVKAANAKQLFAMPDIDGALVGAASLDAAEFIAICEGE